jgi:hypothetical protein
MVGAFMSPISARDKLIVGTSSGKSLAPLGSGAKLLDWFGSKVHPITPSGCEIASSEGDVLLLLACLQHALSPHSADALRSLRQQDSVRPVAQQNAQPNPPSHIVSAMTARQVSFIRIGVCLSNAKIIAMSCRLCRDG